MNVVLAIAVCAAIVALFSTLLRRRIGAWRRFHDIRSRRELLMSVALWLVAVCGATSALFSIAMVGPIDLRRGLGAMAWGALLTYGIVGLRDTRERHGRFEE